MIKSASCLVPKDLFLHTRTSYKFFWYFSIIELVRDTGKSKFSFYEISSCMLAMAWRILKDHNIRFGGKDQIQEILSFLVRYFKDAEISSTKLYQLLIENQNVTRIKRIVSKLYNIVPYHFLTPWVQGTFNRDKTYDLEKLYRSDAMYGIVCDIYEGVKSIAVNPEWEKSINMNARDFLDLGRNEFLSYLENSNEDEQSDLEHILDDALYHAESLFVSTDDEKQCVDVEISETNFGSTFMESIDKVENVKLELKRDILKKEAELSEAQDDEINVWDVDLEFDVFPEKSIEKEQNNISCSYVDKNEKDVIEGGKLIEIRDPKVLSLLKEDILKGEMLSLIPRLCSLYGGVQNLSMGLIDWKNLLDNLKTRFSEENDTIEDNVFIEEDVIGKNQITNFSVIPECDRVVKKRNDVPLESIFDEVVLDEVIPSKKHLDDFSIKLYEVVDILEKTFPVYSEMNGLKNILLSITDQYNFMLQRVDFWSFLTSSLAWMYCDDERYKVLLEMSVMLRSRKVEKVIKMIQNRYWRKEYIQRKVSEDSIKIDMEDFIQRYSCIDGVEDILLVKNYFMDWRKTFNRMRNLLGQGNVRLNDFFEKHKIKIDDWSPERILLRYKDQLDSRKNFCRLIKVDKDIVSIYQKFFSVKMTQNGFYVYIPTNVLRIKDYISIIEDKVL